MHTPFFVHKAKIINIDHLVSVDFRINLGQFHIIHCCHHHREGNCQCCASDVDAGEQPLVGKGGQ